MKTHAHTESPRIGCLIVNLGTPKSPSVTDVRQYLREFLWDKRVVEAPRLPWWLFLNGVILTSRPRKSASAYEKIWTKKGSPLLVISESQQAGLQALFNEMQQPIQVELAMRYGKPSIIKALDNFHAAGIEHVLLLPLYPQYSATTTASIIDAVADAFRNRRVIPELRTINQYHQDSAYIAALALSIRTHWQEHGEPDQLLMSFHGLPQDYADQGDPYPQQCTQTALLLAKELDLDDDQWCLSYQSRLGPKQWLQPYTSDKLQVMAKSGVKRVDVICPGFSADCLETLEEIAMENREIFLQAGGKNYTYIPCLNDQPAHLQALAAMVMRHIKGWT